MTHWDTDMLPLSVKIRSTQDGRRERYRVKNATWVKPNLMLLKRQYKYVLMCALPYPFGFFAVISDNRLRNQTSCINAFLMCL